MICRPACTDGHIKHVNQLKNECMKNRQNKKIYICMIDLEKYVFSFLRVGAAGVGKEEGGGGE